MRVDPDRFGMKTDAGSTPERESQVEPPIVDCDLHVSRRDDAEIAERLPEPFQTKGVFTPTGQWASPIGVPRDDSFPEDGPPGSDPELTVAQVLDPLSIEHAIITGGVCLGLCTHPNRRYAAAVARAYNDWVVEKWTSFDERILASIGVAPQNPEAAADEIHRLGGHPDMVQVIMGSGTRIPLGQRDYWPIYEAAEAEELPVAIHVGPEGRGIANPNSGAGYPSTYTERHMVHPNNYYGQLASVVLEGVFEAFPDLTFVMIEGGVGWVPDLMWRMDRHWRELDGDVPWLTRPPSEYVREHVRFTSQPSPEPEKLSHLHQLLEMIHAEETLMYCTDYPHWDGDYSPKQVLPGVPESTKSAVFSGTARDLYGLS